MKVLVDGSGGKMIDLRNKYGDLIGGQLLTPTGRHAYCGQAYGIDNGAFSGFDHAAFGRLLNRLREDNRGECLFVAAPDIVGSARRTMEAFEGFLHYLEGWPVALVAQDGIEDLPIPWAMLAGIFIGGTTEWKMLKSAMDVCLTARILQKHVHVGRVNTVRRFVHFRDHADTCDGTGLVAYPWMLDAIAAGETTDQPLLAATGRT